jgi:hypothetical protein
MTPAQVFDSLTALEKAEILAGRCDAVTPEAIAHEFVLWALGGSVPGFGDLHYDVQEAILPALRRRA